MSLASFLILLFAIQMGWMARQCHFIQVSVYSWVQGRIQDLAQRGDKSGAKRKKKFVVPPWAPQGGDRGGQNSHSPKILHHLLNEFTRKYQEKNLSPPPWITQGGDILAVPPPELLRRGTILRGGKVPPPQIALGGDSPLVPPPVSALVCHEPNCLDVWYIGRIDNCFIWPGNMRKRNIRDPYLNGLTPSMLMLMLHLSGKTP